MYTIQYNLHCANCETQLTLANLSYMQCSTYLMMISFHFLMITSKLIITLKNFRRYFMTISIGFQDIELLSKNNNDDDNKQIKKYYFFYSNDKGVTSTVNIKVCIG